MSDATHPSGIIGGGVLDCNGQYPTSFPCRYVSTCNNYPRGTSGNDQLSPCLELNCGCYFNWENQNSRGEWNLIFPGDTGYESYCRAHVDSTSTTSCFQWGFDTQLNIKYDVAPEVQACTYGGGIPQKGWQRLRYAPSHYISENEGEIGDKFWFPFPIYDVDGTTPLKRYNGDEYTTEVNADVSSCDCGRLMLFQDTDGYYKIKIDPAKGRITNDGISNHMQLVAYFALPNKTSSTSTKGSDVCEHGFVVIDAVKDCEVDDNNSYTDIYCHGLGKRWNSGVDDPVDEPSDEAPPQCYGEFAIKSYTGQVYFVNSSGGILNGGPVGTISEADTRNSTIPDSLPPYLPSLSSNGLRLEQSLYNKFGAILFNVDPNAESTLPYNKNSTVLAELTANSVELSKFYKTHCCGGGSERIVNILLSKNKEEWEGDNVLPFFIPGPVCGATWTTAAYWFLNTPFWGVDENNTTENLDSYKSTSDQYNGFERKLQKSIDRYRAHARSGSQQEYIGGAFGCRGECGGFCDSNETAIFELVREKLCGSKFADLIGFGGITLPEDAATPKFHVPDSRLTGNALNDFPYYCTNLTIDPVTKYGSFGAVVTGSTLHRYGITSPSSNDYVQGRCVNIETPAGTIKPYQDSRSGDVCSDYISTVSNTNTGDERCYTYWNQRFDQGAGQPQLPTSMEQHWLSGGYFYGNKELRDNIYKELGTIHFNTSLNINNFAYDITTQDKTPKDYSVKINTATEYIDINNLWDIAQSHISVGFATNSIFTGGKTINGLVPFIKYNKLINGYLSTYSASNTIQYVDTSSLVQVKFTQEMGIGNTVTEDAGDICVKLISSKTGLTTEWPKTDNYFTLLTPTQLSFLVDAGSERAQYYNIVNSPTTVSTNIVGAPDTGTPVTTGQYFANNAIESSMAFITDAVPVTTYENYKFFGCIMNDRTILISDGTSDLIYDNLSTKVITTPTTKFDYLSDIKRQIDSNPDTVGLLNLYNYTLNGTNNINIVLNTTTNILSNGGSINKIQILPTNWTTVGISEIRIILNEDIPLLPGKAYGLTYTLPFIIKLISPYSGTTTNLNNKNKEGILTQNTTNNNFSFNSPFPIKNFDVLATGVAYNGSKEYPLFDLNSSKFSTPDYSFIKLSPVSDQSLGTEQIIPLRGAEYSESEKMSYPTYRTIRKANGKYYLQILAGAFPYFHSVVHLPVIKGLSQNDNQESAVEDSLKKVCSKNIDWYNHVATTKWTCLVKHTQFSQNLPEWKSLTNTKGVNQTVKPIIIGRPGPPVINSGSNGIPVITPLDLEDNPVRIALD